MTEPGRRARASRRRVCVLAALGVGLGLAGCTTVGPDYLAPQVPWLRDWSGGSLAALEAAPHEGAVAGIDAWWLNFGDPVLSQLIGEAQRANPGVRSAGLRILEARAQLGIAGSALYPQLQQASGELLSVGQQRNGGADTDFRSYRAGLDIGWELDFWGRFRRAIEAADANYLASIAQYDDVQVLLAAQVADLYAAIRTIELRLRISHENAALQKRSLEITERLFASGNSEELDVQQARALYFGTLATIPELEGTLRAAQNALGVLLGRPPGPLPEMDAGRETIPVAPLAVIVDLPADLLRRRPDVRAAELQLAAQSALVDVSVADLYPSIALAGSVGLSASSQDWSQRSIEWGAGPTLVWNVFDYGRIRNQVRVQDARLQQLHERYQDTVLQAAREVDDAAVGFAQNRAQAGLLAQAAEAARRSLDIATVQYHEGLIDFQRVLDSQRTLFSQQERLVSASGDVTRSLIALYKAMGGGWQTARANPLIDEATRATMRGRSDWNGLLETPLPAAQQTDPAAEAEPE